MMRPTRWMEIAALGAVVALALWARLPGEPQALLWLDEAWRVRQALGDGSYGVLLPSEFAHARVVHALVGLHEASLRALPIAGILLAIASVARLRGTLFHTPVWLWSALTYALAGSFVMHTREFKPYGVDLGLAMATIATAVAACHAPGGRLSRLTLVSSITAASTVIFPFVHAGTCLYLWTRRRFPWTEVAKATVTPCVVFVAMYLGFLAKEDGLESTTSYWESLYVRDWESARHVALVAWDTGDGYSLLGSWGLWGTALVVAPALSLWRRDGFWALLLGPLGAQLGLSAMGMYPLFDRPSFYFYGIAALAAPYAADVLLRSVGREQVRLVLSWIVLAAATIWLVASGRAATHWEDGTPWPPRPDARLVLEKLATDHDGASPVLLNRWIVHTYALYAPLYFPEDSPLRRVDTNRDTAMRNRNVTELCLHLLLRTSTVPAGRTLWFASGHTGYACRYYRELLRRVGDVDVLVDERAACLARVRMTKPMESLRPLCQQLWQRAAAR